MIGLAICTAGVSLVSYVWAPKAYRSGTALAAYVLLVATTGLLVINTGGAASPFIVLWMMSAIFAGLFGNIAIVGLCIALITYLLYLFAIGILTSNNVQSLIMAGALPLIVSYILWHSKASNDKSKERAYYDLANELNQVSNKSEVVINAIADGVIAINNQGIIELINPAAQHIAGWGRQDALGLEYKAVLQLLGNDGHELDNTKDPIFDTLTTNQQKRAKDLQLQTNSGKRIPISIVASPTGRLGSGAIIVFRDTTKEAAEEREQAEFVSTASHEMRTPVAAIEGYLGLALNPQTATIDDKAREFIGKAHESAQHLGRLFQDLLDVTKADDGRLSNNPKVVDLVHFTKDIIEDLQPKAIQKNLHIFFRPLTSDDESGSSLVTATPIFYSYVDADHLREVLSNLIENAVKYTPAGEVTVDINGDNDHTVVSISDSGIGIPAEDIPHLFQKFYRVDNSDTREIGGTGLGLYLCRKLVDALGGRIWVESTHKHGSTFFVEIPRISHEEANRLIEASVQEKTIIEDRDYVASDSGKVPSQQTAPVLTNDVLLHHLDDRTKQHTDEPATPPSQIIMLHKPKKPHTGGLRARSSNEPRRLTITPLSEQPSPVSPPSSSSQSSTIAPTTPVSPQINPLASQQELTEHTIKP